MTNKTADHLVCMTCGSHIEHGMMERHYSSLHPDLTHRLQDARHRHWVKLRDALQTQNHQEIHNLLVELDKEYQTLPESPLHHDRRCPIHRTSPFSYEPPPERGVNP